MSAPVRSVAVIGGGVPAAVAALALARAYGRLGLTVTLVETGEAPSPHAAYATMPDIRAFHRLLGVEEGAFLREAGGTLSVGQQFVGWSGEGSAFLHAFGEAGKGFASLPFIQHWTRARLAGLNVGLENFCPAAVAARHGRVHTQQGAQYGYHLDAAGYARLLLRLAEAAGVIIARDVASTPEIGEGNVEAIRLSTGGRIEADLFVDADGSLIDALDGEPAPAEGRPRHDRIIRASAPRLDPRPLYARAVAHAAGYALLMPLQDRTAVELVYDSDRLGDDEALAALPRLAGVAITAHDAAVSVPARRRGRRWIGNCVALDAGLDAAPSLDAAPLLELQLAVGQSVLLLPVNRTSMPEAAIYNEEMGGQAARIADFTAMHFRLNRRIGEAFWDEARAAPISSELAAKIALFGARGMFAHFDHEAHVVDSWALCMVGHGHLPASYDPEADRVDEQKAMAAFQSQLRAIAQDVPRMETHADALARLAGPVR